MSIFESIVGYGFQALDLEKLGLHTNSGVSSSIEVGYPPLWLLRYAVVTQIIL